MVAQVGQACARYCAHISSADNRDSHDAEYSNGRGLEQFCSVGSNTMQALPALAFRTEVRRALRHDDASDRCATRHARFARLSVHSMADLKPALPALGIDVVRDRRSTGLD